MHRFLSREALQLAPGDHGLLGDGASFRVVDSVQHPDGRCEFLAVSAAGGARGDEEGAGEAPAASAADTARLEASALALPYPLPD
jgi:hypothetical protein